MPPSLIAFNFPISNTSRRMTNELWWSRPVIAIENWINVGIICKLVYKVRWRFLILTFNFMLWWLLNIRILGKEALPHTETMLKRAKSSLLALICKRFYLIFHGDWVLKVTTRPCPFCFSHFWSFLLVENDAPCKWSFTNGQFRHAYVWKDCEICV